MKFEKNKTQNTVSVCDISFRYSLNDTIVNNTIINDNYIVKCIRSFKRANGEKC